MRELNNQLWAAARTGKRAVQGLLFTRHESLVGEVDRLLREGAEINSPDAFGSPSPPSAPLPAAPLPPPSPDAPFRSSPPASNQRPGLPLLKQHAVRGEGLALLLGNGRG